MSYVRVDVSEQLEQIRKQVERACHDILDANEADRNAVADRLAQGTQLERAVARYYRRLVAEQGTKINASELLNKPIVASSPWPGVVPFPKESSMRKIKITHDGKGRACDGLITDAETGALIHNVSRVDITLDANEAAARAVLHIDNVALDFTANAEIRHTLHYDPTDIDSIDRAIAFLQGQRAERTRQ
jgi:hypothetical protein